MASRKPLVLVSGEIQQLQAGDTLNAAISEVDVVSLINNEASGTHVIGNLVYISSAGNGKKAVANAAGTKDAFAMATATVANAATGTYQTEGTIDLTSWAGGALSPGVPYYLDPATAGGMTTTAPTTAGQYVVRVGIAESTVLFHISIERPILL